MTQDAPWRRHVINGLLLVAILTFGVVQLRTPAVSSTPHPVQHSHATIAANEGDVAASSAPTSAQEDSALHTNEQVEGSRESYSADQVASFAELTEGIPQYLWEVAKLQQRGGKRVASDVCKSWGSAATKMTQRIDDNTGSSLRQPLQWAERNKLSSVQKAAPLGSSSVEAHLLISFKPAVKQRSKRQRGGAAEAITTTVGEKVEDYAQALRNQLAVTVDSIEILSNASPEDNSAYKVFSCNNLMEKGYPMAHVHLCVAHLLDLVSATSEYKRVWVVVNYGNLFEAPIVPARVMAQLGNVAGSDDVLLWKHQDSNAKAPKATAMCALVPFLRTSCYDIPCSARLPAHSVHSVLALKKPVSFPEYIWPTSNKSTNNNPSRTSSAPTPFILTIPRSGVAVYRKLAATAHLEHLDGYSTSFLGLEDVAIGSVSSNVASVLGILTSWGIASRASLGQQAASSTFFAPNDGIGVMLTPVTDGAPNLMSTATDRFASLWKLWTSPLPSPAAVAAGVLDRQLSPLVAGIPVPKFYNRANQYIGGTQTFPVPKFLEENVTATTTASNEKNEQEPTIGGAHDHQLCSGVTALVAIRHPDIMRRADFTHFLTQLAIRVRRVVALTSWVNNFNRDLWPIPAVCSLNHGATACLAWLAKLQFVRDSCGLLYLHADSFVDLSRFFSTTSIGGLRHDGRDDANHPPTAAKDVDLLNPGAYGGADVDEIHKAFVSVKSTLSMAYHPDEWPNWRSPYGFGEELKSNSPQMMMDSWGVMNDISVAAYPALVNSTHVANARFNNFADIFYVPVVSRRRNKRRFQSQDGASMVPAVDGTMDLMQELVERSVLPTVIAAEGSIMQILRYTSALQGAEFKATVPQVHSPIIAFYADKKAHASFPWHSSGNKQKADAERAEYWGSSIVRSFSAHGHCCAFLPPRAVDNWRYVGFHKLSLGRKGEADGMTQRLTEGFACKKNAVRLQYLRPSEDGLTWRMTTKRERSQSRRVPTSAPTLLASTSTTCKVELLLGTTDGSQQHNDDSDQAVWKGGGAAVYIVQAPLSGNVNVHAPLSPQRGDVAVLYIIAPNAGHLSVHLPKQHAAPSLGQQHGGLEVYVATGASIPFKLTATTHSNGTAVLEGSRAKDIIRIGCSRDAVRAYASTNDENPLIDVALSLSPYPVVRSHSSNGLDPHRPHIDVQIAAAAVDSSKLQENEQCVVTVESRTDFVPSWG